MSESMHEALGRDVMASDTATSVGSVKAFVVDQPPRQITALHVTGRKRAPELIDWSEVVGFGPDVVMVSSEKHLREPEQDREEEMSRHSVDPLGGKILDTSGYEHGEVSDVVFNKTSGAIDHILTTEGRTIAATAIRSLGSYALVVD